MKKYTDLAKKVFREHGVEAEADVHLVDEQEMSNLHMKYMNLTGPTDVLSFPLDTTLPDGKRFLGDIVICESEAKKYGESIEFLVEHGCLHLLGIHHKE